MSSPSFVSLFSGCGGLDHGFVQAGYKGVLSVDIDEIALAVHQANLACPTQVLDLTKNDPAIDSNCRFDVLLAGSPCQGFSTIGQRRIDDPRNALLWVAARVAAKHKPRIVIAENVPGALAGDHRHYWEALHQRLHQIGYATTDLKLDCADFGVAQHRRRIFLVASLAGNPQEVIPKALPRIPLSLALAGVEGVANHNPNPLLHSSSDYKIALRIAQGQKLTNARGGPASVHTWDIPEVFGKTTKKEKELLNFVLRLRRQERRRPVGDADPVSTAILTAKFGVDVVDKLVKKNYLRQIGEYHDLTHTFNGKYRRPRLEGPCRTVDTRFGDPKLSLHPTEHRPFTVREAARIQGFDDKFIFSGNIDKQFRMIGNAVPPPVAFNLATMVRHFL